jgi:phytanoyl-CoA hydroxylase
MVKTKRSDVGIPGNIGLKSKVASPAVKTARPVLKPAPLIAPVPTQAPEVVEGLGDFDESYYTNRYKDVAESIAAGVWHNGLMHYAMSGRASSRVAGPKVEEAWYQSAYPQAAAEVAAGKARTFADHYHHIGRYRGYLAAPKGVRMEDPGRTRSRYGGLWTDHGNVLDLIDGRVDLGKLTAQEASLLRRWVTDGYVILPKAVPEDLMAPALADLEGAYNGKFPDMRFDIHGIGRSVPWAAESQVSPAKALDIHWHSEAVRKAMFAPAILDFLHLIFERRALASQTLGFWRGSQQNGHQDSAYVCYSMPMQFAASWIALEDVKEGAGELFYHVGSHRVGEYRFHNRFKGVAEAKRLGFADANTEAQIGQHVERLAKQAQGLGLRTERFLAKRGDALIWAADLVHGGSTISKSQTRKSLVTHYCPADCAPLYFESGKPPRLRKHGAESYSTSYYKK